MSQQHHLKSGTCGTCCHWDQEHGRCHRYAPRPSTPNELMDEYPPMVKGDNIGGAWNMSLTCWPVTDIGDFCGDWRANR